MGVKYVLSLKGNPSNSLIQRKYYAQTKCIGEVTLRRLSKEIASASAPMREPDVYVVLNALAKALNRHLSEGRIIRFGDFGSFQISLKSEGAGTPEEFNNALIKDARVAFRPSPSIKKMLNSLKYEKL